MDAPDIAAMSTDDPETVANWPASAWCDWLRDEPRLWAQLTPGTVALLNSEILNQLVQSLPADRHPLTWMRRSQMRAWLLCPGNDCRDLHEPTMALICIGLLADWQARRDERSSLRTGPMPDAGQLARVLQGMH